MFKAFIASTPKSRDCVCCPKNHTSKGEYRPNMDYLLGPAVVKPVYRSLLDDRCACPEAGGLPNGEDRYGRRCEKRWWEPRATEALFANNALRSLLLPTQRYRSVTVVQMKVISHFIARLNGCVIPGPDAQKRLLKLQSGICINSASNSQPDSIRIAGKKYPDIYCNPTPFVAQLVIANLFSTQKVSSVSHVTRSTGMI